MTPRALVAAMSLLALPACAPSQERCADPTERAPAPLRASAPAREFFHGNLHEAVEESPIGQDEATKLVPLFENADHTINVIQTRGAVPPHYHADHDELVVVIQGSGTFRVGDSARAVKAGDVQVIPRGAVHSYVHEGPGVTVVMSTFSPRFDPKDRIRVDAGAGAP